MKKNGNNIKVKDYYVGIDSGASSCGWAVTDTKYNLLKHRGKDMWGARLYEEAHTAEDRRIARGQRRRLDRRTQRLDLLEVLFNNEITKKDPTFFRRMHDSNLWKEDKNNNTCKYSLFNDDDFTDKDYLKAYPTIYHLRSELIHSKEPHDVRLVFLAVHHIIKSRGHFLYESSGDDSTRSMDEALNEFIDLLVEYEIDFQIENYDDFKDAINAKDTLTNRSLIKKAYGNIEKGNKQLNGILDLLVGSKVKLSVIFDDDNLKDVESVSLMDDLESQYDLLSNSLNELQLNILFSMKEIFDISRLTQVLGKEKYISDAKIRLFEKNKNDLKLLKEYVKKNYPDRYDLLFKKVGLVDEKNKRKKYDIYLSKEGDTQETFCNSLKKALPDLKKSTNPEIHRIYTEIEDKTFFTKLKGSENGLIPYQIHLKELKKILLNASEYLPFLNKKDNQNLTIIDKVESLFTFRIPYYVGPLSTNATHNFVVRTDDKIYPWNFDQVVDRKASSKNFMKNLIGRCTYTGDPVLPKDSLIYSRYSLLNELNNLKINSKPVPFEMKKEIITKLFEESSKLVTIKKLRSFLLANGMIETNDELSGVDITIKSNLKSFHDFKDILNRTHDKNLVEEIIEHVVVFGNDKKMLNEWLMEYPQLEENDRKKILRLKYKDWGRLSKKLLVGIRCEDPETHEICSIIDELENNSINLQQLLSNKYKYAESAKKYKDEKYGVRNTVSEMIEDLYIAPAVKRSINQAVKILDELVDIEKGAPKKIFIEMARDNALELKKKRTTPRKEKLVKLYESCNEQQNELYNKLQTETDSSLRRDKLYLYYTQFGKCMYSGNPIDLDKLLKDNQTYDIDHIFPRSRIKDNSLNNKVLVESKYNRDKTNTYPINDDIRNKMHSFWGMLHDKNLISDKKYERLIRSTELTDDELHSFIARQLVETQQSTKALATILQTIYPNTKIVYSKAGNISSFRQDFQIPKFRDVNDFHHAKDAYLNIVVGNVYDTKFTEKFFMNIKNEKYSLNRVFDDNTNGAWIAPSKEEMKQYRDAKKSNNSDRGALSGTLKTIYKYVFKNTPIVTIAPYEGKGILCDLQILSKGKGQLPVKKSMDIEKYGGYNKLKGSFYNVVRYIDGKKVKTGIFPVYIKDVLIYNSNPIKYCKEILQLENPKVIVEKVRINSVIELDGFRYALSSRTGNNLIYKNIYQLTIDDEKSQYFKEINKYIERCAASKQELPLTKKDVITLAQNLEMYEWVIYKIKNSIYKNIFAKECEVLEKGREKYRDLSILEQLKVLSEILCIFKCNCIYANLTLIGGVKVSGRIQASQNIANRKSAYLINQSVTGLYEKKINLLEG